jgi:signal transduction histidine kinase
VINQRRIEATTVIWAPERRVIVGCERESDCRVQVSVRDLGVGLPVKERQRIFEQFFSTKREQMGIADGQEGWRESRQPEAGPEV